jgi:hypothetical protein
MQSFSGVVQLACLAGIAIVMRKVRLAHPTTPEKHTLPTNRTAQLIRVDAGRIRPDVLLTMVKRPSHGLSQLPIDQVLAACK